MFNQRPKTRAPSAPPGASFLPSLSEPLLATCATPSPGQMVVSEASGAAETCQNNLLQQVSANCARQPRQRRRVPALPGREQMSSFCGGSVGGSGPQTQQDNLGTRRGRPAGASKQQMTAFSFRGTSPFSFFLLSLLCRGEADAAPAGCSSLTARKLAQL